MSEKKAIFAICIAVCIVWLGSAIFSHIKNMNHANNGKTLTKDAVDELIDRAANQKYIQDVLSDNPKLPLSKKSIPLQPNSYSEITDNSNQTTNEATEINLQRCIYNGQTYVPGDIVKTDQNWIRCTPTIIFSQNNPTQEQTGTSAWTAVQ